jgi:ABC-type antimicrobial peptide transport system permease subunit
MEEVASESIAVPRFRALLVSLFAATALVLAGIGIFNVLAFSVHQRTREFGIRLALGARPSNLLGLVLGEGLKVTGAGLALGLASAALLTRSLTTLLYQVEPLDPVTFLGAPAMLGITALAACAVPAIRAARMDSASALRQE